MGAKIADSSKNLLLDSRLGAAPFTHMNMGLSTFAGPSTHATVIGDLTPGEPAVAGYARQAVNTWAPAALTIAFKAYSEAAPVTFINTSGGDTALIKSWFWIDTVTGDLVASGQFNVPFVLAATVGSYTTTPAYTVDGE